MKPKQYLKQLSTINQRIETYVEELNTVNSLLGSISSPPIFRQNHTTNVKPYADYTVIIERRDFLKDKIQQETLKKNCIIDQIRALDNPIYIKILYKRYEKEKKLIDIANELGYEYDYMRRLHGKALQAFQKEFLQK